MQAARQIRWICAFILIYIYGDEQSNIIMHAKNKWDDDGHKELNVHVAFLDPQRTSAKI